MEFRWAQVVDKLQARTTLQSPLTILWPDGFERLLAQIDNIEAHSVQLEGVPIACDGSNSQSNTRYVFYVCSDRIRSPLSVFVEHLASKSQPWPPR
jgi:hypothetical protein